MRKYTKILISILTAFMLEILVFSRICFAAGDISFTLSADDNIKAGKGFNLYLTFSSSENIGGVRAAIDFDSENLTLTSAVLQDKTQGDYFSYGNTDGRSIFVYTNHDDNVHERTVKYHFTQKNSENTQYIFTTAFYEAIDKDLIGINCSSVPRITISINQNVSTTNELMLSSSDIERSNIENQDKNSSANTDSKSSSSQSDTISNSSKKSSETQNNIIQRGQSDISINENNSTYDESIAVREYSLIQHSDNIDNGSEKTNMFIGFGIVVAAAMIVAYKYGEKSRKNKP